MPWGLRRFQETGQLYFLTFSCYKRRPKFANALSRSAFENSLERVRRHYGLCVHGYVVMPEHVHMLVDEPAQGSLARAMQSLKQSVARNLALRAEDPFWQARYYDFNVWSEGKFVEKLRYIHRNPVTRGLVARPEDWAWSSFCHYVNGEAGAVEIESQWTARRREHGGDLSDCAKARGRGPAQAELGRGTLVSLDEGLLRRFLDGCNGGARAPTIFSNVFCYIFASEFGL